MNSANVDVFFSCSFAEEDKKLNEFFYAICNALDIRGSNVSGAFAQTPPEKAKQMIADSQALIAICTRRTEMLDGKYFMPDAVRDEIAFAYGQDIPVLMFVEDGVQLAGFNFGTHLRFDRNTLGDPDVLEKVVKSIHAIKLDVLSPSDLMIGQDSNEFYVEYVRSLKEMKELDGGYCWVYSAGKMLKFIKHYKRSFKAGAWASVPSKLAENSELISWELKVESASRDLDIKHTIEKHTPECLEVLLKIEPSPVEGDYIEYSTIISSPFLNPVWDEDVADGAPLHLEAGDFRCSDGSIFTHRTKKALLVFRFPRSYGLGKHDIVPFVGSHSSSVDYEVESEIKRANIQIESIAGNIEVKMEVDSPLRGHVYGIAWNPKKKKV